VFSRDRVAEESGDSKSQVQRYIRLTELMPDMLELVDAGKIAMRPAVELSYLPKEEQAHILDAIRSEACTPSHAQAIKLRRFSDEGRLSPDVALSIMCEEKPNQAEQVRIPRDRLSKFFAPGTPADRIEARIIRGLELLERQERSRGDAR
jgi:ParB family chromosome partitioning protein